MDAIAAAREQAFDPGTDPERRAGGRIELRRIVKRYGLHRAVDDIDLDVRPGEFITLLGPSGSGKTTTLMLVAGFERPSGGEILIDGRPVARLPAYKRGIGMVFQSYALFPHLTVAENIGFALKQRGVAKAARAAEVARMLDLVQLQGFAGRFPQQLSGGQQQRVAIARAVVFNPRVLLMDEPLSALDKQLRENLQLEIKRLHDRLGITFVYVTHDQREALVMSDRVCVMNEGRIEQIAAPQALYDAPANRFVAAFIGEANFLPLRAVTRERGGLALTTEDGAGLRAPLQAYADGAVGMIRPERIQVAPAGGMSPDASPGRNALRATVREVVFMGEMTRYTVETPSRRLLSVKQANCAGTPILEASAPVTVHWAVEDTRLVS
jgi:putative spermidine/putrescine transport system ATP-binding protein